MMNLKKLNYLLGAICLSSVIACSSSPDAGIDNNDILSDAELSLDQPASSGGGSDQVEAYSDEFGDEEMAFDDAAAGEEAVADAPAAADDEGFSEDDLESFDDESFADESVADAPAEEPLDDTLGAPADETADAFADSFNEEPSFSSSNANPVRVQSIDFIANKSGGTLQVKTSGVATYNGRYNASTNQYILEIANATLEPQVKRPYIMKEFQTAFGVVNSYQNSGGSTARIVVQMKSTGEPIVQQEGDKILLVAAGNGVVAQEPSVTAVKKDDWKSSYNVEEAEKEEKILGARTLEEFLAGNNKFFGRPISIQVDDADIEDVINFIADESGVNLVLSEDVKGTISLKLRQIPWDQALVIVMRSKGLGYVRQGSVIRVTKLETLQEETKAAQEIISAQSKLTPIKVKVIPVSYATVADLEKQVLPFLTAERGKVVSDARTSSLIVTDTPNVLSRVERLVQELDIPPAQVMIEGKIVEATEKFSRQLGVNWSLSGVPAEISSGGGFQGNPIQLTPSFSSSPLGTSTTGNLTMSIGTLDFFGQLDARLGIAQSDSLARVVSAPRVVTMNREEATIAQKGETLSRTITGAGDDKTETIVRTPVELSLKVIPQITAEGSVILDVNVKRQFAGAKEEGLGAEPVNTREAKTKVLVPNGQTAVIGGIYASQDSKSETGLPVLKDVPVLGWLFKSHDELKEKNELLIFLTPRILNAKDQGVVN